MNAKKVVRDSKTYCQSLFGYAGRYANFAAGGASGEAGGVCDTNLGDQFTDGDKACYLISTKWQNPRMQNDWATNENAFSAGSLGMAGEAGYETKQIVGSTGYCLDSRHNRNSGKLTSLPCDVNAELLDPICEYISWCNVPNNRYGQAFTCTEADSVTGVSTLTTPKLTAITTSNNDGSNEQCLMVSNGVEFSLASGCEPSFSDSTHSFYRFGYVGSTSKVNYKFVLASTLNVSNPDASTNPLCLTQMTPDNPAFDYASKWYDPTIADVALQSCTVNTENNLSQTTYPQEWNAPSDYDHDNGPTTGSSSGGGSSDVTRMTLGTGNFTVTKKVSGESA